MVFSIESILVDLGDFIVQFVESSDVERECKVKLSELFESCYIVSMFFDIVKVFPPLENQIQKTPTKSINKSDKTIFRQQSLSIAYD